MKNIHGISVLDKNFKHLLPAALCGGFIFFSRKAVEWHFSAYTTDKACIYDNIVEKTTSDLLLKK